jgi:hypothetical protein
VSDKGTAKFWTSVLDCQAIYRRGAKENFRRPCDGNLEQFRGTGFVALLPIPRIALLRGAQVLHL